eukprot:gene14720-14845_t
MFPVEAIAAVEIVAGVTAAVAIGTETNVIVAGTETAGGVTAERTTPDSTTWRVGERLPYLFLSDIYYIDFGPYGLPRPPYGYRWVRFGPDVLLVNVYTGEIVDVVPIGGSLTVTRDPALSISTLLGACLLAMSAPAQAGPASEPDHDLPRTSPSPIPRATDCDRLLPAMPGSSSGMIS